jgi:hypothetical protein
MDESIGSASSNLGKLRPNGLKRTIDLGAPHVFYSRATREERQRLWPTLVRRFF